MDLFCWSLSFSSRCCEKESLDGTLRRILCQKEANTQRSGNGNNGNFAGGQGLWTSLKLLRGDQKQVNQSFNFNDNGLESDFVILTSIRFLGTR